MTRPVVMRGRFTTSPNAPSSCVFEEQHDRATDIRIDELRHRQQKCGARRMTQAPAPSRYYDRPRPNQKPSAARAEVTHATARFSATPVPWCGHRAATQRARSSIVSAPGQGQEIDAVPAGSRCQAASSDRGATAFHGQTSWQMSHP